MTDRGAIETTLAALDPLDVMIGNAGIVESAPFLDVTPEQWRLIEAPSASKVAALGEETL